MARPPAIHVEGANDLHALVHLLIRHGIDYASKPWPPSLPKFHEAVSDSGDVSLHAPGVEALLTTISDEVKNQANGVVGFVVDADESPTDRWISIRDRLAASAVTSLDDTSEPVENLATIPAGGFLGVSQKYKTRVGVWLMPDNQTKGAVEHFLRTLIPGPEAGEPDPLYQFAETCTAEAQKKREPRAFRDVDMLKATLACWLAWQENPGRPYGTAIRARYLQHDSPVAQQFVTWFKTLFQIA